MAKAVKSCGAQATQVDNHSVVHIGTETFNVTRVHTCERDHSGDVYEESNPDLRKHECSDPWCGYRWVTGEK